ncbi:MAG: hypothetical protein GEU82_18325 [Luteitalea sp.]|nr:hypothetical protein [Luteitalea sp.]
MAFFDASFGAGRRATEPTLDLLHADCVFRGRLAHLHVEDRGRTDVIDPRVTFEHAHPENRRFIQRFSLDLGDVADAAHVHERDGARPQRHATDRSIFAFYSPRHTAQLQAHRMKAAGPGSRPTCATE